MTNIAPTNKDIVIGSPRMRKASKTALIGIASRGANLILRQIFEYGFFHGDPHPGNVFVLPDNIICFLDYGMMGRIDEETKDILASLVKAFIDKDVSETTRWLLKLYPAEKINLREFKLDIGEMLDQYHGVPLKQIELKRVFRQVLYLVERHHLKIPPDLFLLDKALVSLEGIGRPLDPDFNAVEQIQPFIKEIIKKKLSPRTIASKWQKNLGEFFTLFQESPQEIRSMLSLLKKGEMKVKFEHRGLDTLIGARPKTVIFPPANSGTSGSNYNPRNTQCMDACPVVFKRGGYNFRLPPLKVRDLRLDLGKNP